MEWTQFLAKPTTIGNGRGFLVPVNKLRLDSGKQYIIKIIELEQFKIDKGQYSFGYKEMVKNEVIHAKCRAKAS